LCHKSVTKRVLLCDWGAVDGAVDKLLKGREVTLYSDFHHPA